MSRTHDMGVTSVSRSLLIKVPEITAYFWVIKILSTTVGETFADFLNTTLGLGLNGTSIVMGTALLAALVLQISQKRYVASAYWVSVVLTSITGTLLTDNLTDNLGISLIASSTVFSILLAASFVLWKRSENTLSIHSIDTRRREVFYWVTILLTFALGTATGDLIAERLAVGYGWSFWIFVALIGMVVISMRFRLIGTVLAFWSTYVLTRPLGAAIGDYLSQAKADGGIGWGTTVTSLVFLSIITVVVTFLTVTKKDVITRPVL